MRRESGGGRVSFEKCRQMLTKLEWFHSELCTDWNFKNFTLPGETQKCIERYVNLTQPMPYFVLLLPRWKPIFLGSTVALLAVDFQCLNCCTGGPPYPRIQYPRFQLSGVDPRAERNLKNWRNKRFISFKTRAKRERAVTWWNPATETRPVLNLPYFVPIPTLPRKLAAILYVVFSMFELVAALSHCRRSQ